MSDNFDLKKYLIENKATTNSRMLTENEMGKFYAPTYLEQKYGQAVAKKIEGEIDELDANAWDRFTAMESAEEVEDSIADIKDMLGLSETKKKHSKMMKEVDFKVQRVSKVVFPNGLSFRKGEEDMEGGKVIFIEKFPKGYAVSGQEFDWDNQLPGEEAYTYYYDLQGSESTEDEIVPDGYFKTDSDMTEMKKKHSKMMKEASDSDREAIENWYHRTNFYIDDLSPEEIEKGIQDHYEEWTAEKSKYSSIEDYFADVERNSDWY